MNNEKRTKYRDRATGEKITEKVYGVLASLGDGWHNRSAIAEAMHKRLLNSSDKGALALLVAAGRVEARSVSTVHTAMLTRWEYRIVDQESVTNVKT